VQALQSLLQDAVEAYERGAARVTIHVRAEVLGDGRVALSLRDEANPFLETYAG
jgi:hypothetical protein